MSKGLETGEQQRERPSLEELKRILNEVIKKDPTFVAYDEIVNKAEDLKGKYADWAEYELYHFLVSSTPREGESLKYDFPGEDSVEKFVRDLNNKYIGKQI